MPRSIVTEPGTPAVGGAPVVGAARGGGAPSEAGSGFGSLSKRQGGDSPRDGRGGGASAGAGASATAGAGGPIADEVLVVRLRGGDAAAGEALCRRYAQPLLRYLQRLAGEGMAEELHQQTWLSVLDNLEKFDSAAASQGVAPAGGSSGFKAWLFRIATNKANDHWRSRGREKAAKEGLRLLTDDSLPHAGHRLEGTEQEQKLRRAIELLPEPQRQVLLLRYYGNMKFIEIAKLLGCPLNTALGRMHKATLKLRQLMAE
jgi:RNA polymerase sigma factor (sigma-70 family)